MQDLAIRRAGAADAAAIAAVHVAAWHEAYAGLVPDGMLSAHSVADRTERWRRIIAVPDPVMESAVFVAADGDRVIGFGSCGRQREAALLADGLQGEISALYLRATHYRRGVGRSLMATMARDLIGRGIAGAGLWVLRDNLRARRFYEGLGGRLVGARIEPVGAFVTAERAGAAADAKLHEVAYGWPELGVLAG